MTDVEKIVEVIVEGIVEVIVEMSVKMIVEMIVKWPLWRLDVGDLVHLAYHHCDMIAAAATRLELQRQRTTVWPSKLCNGQPEQGHRHSLLSGSQLVDKSHCQ